MALNKGMTYNTNTGFYNPSTVYSAPKTSTSNLASNTIAKNNEFIARELTHNAGAVNAAQLNSTDTYKNPIGAGRVDAPPVNDTKTPSGGGSGSANVSVSGGGSDYLSQLSAILAGRQAQLTDAYNNSRGNIESAYASAIGAINDAFNRSSGLMEQNYNASNNALNASYQNDLTGLKDDAARSLREAYINKMLSQKNLNQKMSAAGLSGGATETTLAGLLNNYGNARNNIDTTLNTNIRNLDVSKTSALADILNTYNSNMASLNQYMANAQSSAYQNKASALVGIEQAYANAMANAMSDQYSSMISALSSPNLAKNVANVDLSQILNYRGDAQSSLNDALNKLADTKLTRTEANNAVMDYITNQVGIDNISTSTNYAEYIKELIEALSQGR